jgi:hypothetical protein
LKKCFRVVFLIPAVLALLSCGKVADPLPPVVRIPEPVADFQVSQVGYQLQFVWTNPSRNVDATLSNQLTQAVIRSDGEIVLEVPVSGPGQRQGAELDSRLLVGSSPNFSIQIQSGSDRLSASSSLAPITITPVPGPVSDLGAIVDQDRIALDWTLPTEGRELIESIRVDRSTELLEEVRGALTSFEDREYLVGGTYTYVVVGVRALPDGTFREGVGSSPLEIEARDVVPPEAPGGLVLRGLDDGALLAWDIGPETDIAGYRVFRRDDPADEFVALNDTLLVVTGYNDAGYLPPYAYRVSAVDRSGNESPWSEPVE